MMDEGLSFCDPIEEGLQPHQVRCVPCGVTSVARDTSVLPWGDSGVFIAVGQCPKCEGLLIAVTGNEHGCRYWMTDLRSYLTKREKGRSRKTHG